MSETHADSVFQDRLRGASRGEGWAYTELYEAYAGRIKAFAATRNTDDADAVANDVMLRVFQNIGSFEGSEDRFTSWVFTIARNRLIDLHRAAQRRPITADAEPDEGSAPVGSAEEHALERLGTDEVLSLLDCLTDDQRDVVVLRMLNDLSLASVADIIDKPVTAVKALQRRALQRLQKEILEKRSPDG